MTDWLDKVREAQNSGRHREAVEYARKLNSKKRQRTAESVSLEATSLVALGDFFGAETCLREGLKAKLTRNSALMLSQQLIQLLSRQRKFGDAVRQLSRLIKWASEKQTLGLRLQRVELLTNAQRFDLAIKECESLLESGELKVPASLSLMEIGILKSDSELFERSLGLLKEEVANISDDNLFAVIERTIKQKPSESSIFVREARKRDLSSHRLDLFLANKCFEEGNRVEAMNYLKKVSEFKLPAYLKPLFYKVLATLQEREERYEEAFLSFKRMNDLSLALLPPDWQKSEFDPVRPFSQERIAEDDYRTPLPLVFVVGFPRSGTTLVQSILDSQEGIRILDEKPVIHSLKEKIVADGFQLDDCLVQISTSYTNELRKLYFALVEQYLGPIKPDEIQLIVDKNPLQLIDLPLIDFLFPSAKIVLVMRHPLDSILSCYQQVFEMNSQMPHFLKWELCFEHFARVFDSFQRSSSSKDLYLVKYEDLIASFSVQTADLFDYLDYQPDEEKLANFSTLARERIINTPSSSQVRKGIYTSATFRWTKYRAQIEPNIPIVAREIARYGYHNLI